jgi:hypothetical protein
MRKGQTACVSELGLEALVHGMEPWRHGGGAGHWMGPGSLGFRGFCFTQETFELPSFFVEARGMDKA